eukprot:5783494-Prymnesium_polylepis.2
MPRSTDDAQRACCRAKRKDRRVPTCQRRQPLPPAPSCPRGEHESHPLQRESEPHSPQRARRAIGLGADQTSGEAKLA